MLKNGLVAMKTKLWASLGGVIVLTGATYIGATLYIKEQLKPYLKQTQADLFLLKHFPRAKIDKVETLNSSFFSTTRRITLTANTDCFPELNQLKGDKFYITETWHYGPLPFGLTLKPSALAIEGTLSADPTTQKAWGLDQFFAENKLGSYRVTAGFDKKSFVATVSVPSIKYEDRFDKLIWSGLDATIRSGDIEGKTLFHLQSKELFWKNRESRTLQDLSLDGFTNSHASGALQGEANLKIANTTITSDFAKENFENIALSTKAEAKNDFWGFQVKLGADKGLLSNQTKMGQSHIEFALDHVKLKPFGDFMKTLSTPVCVVDTKNTEDTQVTLNKLAARAQSLKQNLLTILQGQPKVQIKSLQVALNDMKLTGAGDIVLEQANANDLDPGNRKSFLRNSSGQLHLRVKQTELKQFLTESAFEGFKQEANYKNPQNKVAPNSEMLAEYQKNAKIKADELIAGYLQDGVAIAESDAYALKLTLEHGRILINGKNIPLLDAFLAEEGEMISPTSSNNQ